MSDQCKTCPSNGQCSSNPSQCGAESEAESNLLGSLNHVQHIIAVMSGKGGVGKSSVSGLLAASLAQKGKKVGILDADITGPSQPKAFGIQTGVKMKATDFGIQPPVTAGGIKLISINFFLPHEDDPVIWRGPMLAGAVTQFWNEVDWRDLDYMVVDLPPGTGDVPLTVLQSIPVNGLVIVSSPQDLAFMVVKKTIKMAQKMNIPILGLVENMSYTLCPHCHERIEIFGKSQGPRVAEECQIEFLGGLPWDSNLTALFDRGMLEEYASPDMENIVKKIMAHYGD